MFEEIAIEVDGSIVHAPMHQPFAAFHDEGFRGWIMDGAKTNPGPLPDRGSNEDILVEMLGIEPRSNGISLDILRAQLTLNCRESFAGQRPKFSVVDLNFPHHHQRMNSVRPTE